MVPSAPPGFSKPKTRAERRFALWESCTAVRITPPKWIPHYRPIWVRRPVVERGALQLLHLPGQLVVTCLCRKVHRSPLSSRRVITSACLAILEQKLPLAVVDPHCVPIRGNCWDAELLRMIGGGQHAQLHTGVDEVLSWWRLPARIALRPRGNGSSAGFRASSSRSRRSALLRPSRPRSWRAGGTSSVFPSLLVSCPQRQCVTSGRVSCGAHRCQPSSSRRMIASACLARSPS